MVRLELYAISLKNASPFLKKFLRDLSKYDGKLAFLLCIWYDVYAQPLFSARRGG